VLTHEIVLSFVPLGQERLLKDGLWLKKRLDPLTGQEPLSVQEFVRKNAATFPPSAKAA
jgi:hypothetical protein